LKIEFESFQSVKSKDKDLAVQLKKDIEFKKRTSDKILKFLDMLGYDNNSNLIYATINTQTFKNIQWLEATDCSRPKSYYDVNQKKFILGRESFFVEDHILKHTFPLELKNRKKYKHYNLYQNSIDNDTLYNMQYINNDMCGCYLKKQSDILCIDIDNHAGAGSLYTYQVLISFCEFIKSKPIYLERSSLGGYHAFFKLDKDYNFDDKRNLLTDFKEHSGYHLELVKKLRFPNSINYESITSDHEIIKYIDAVDNAIALYSVKKDTIVLKENIINECVIKKVKKVSSVFKRERQCTIKHITPEDAMTDTSLNIERGNRVLPLLKIVRVAKFNNWTIDQTIDFIHKKDSKINPSNDLAIWSNDRLQKEIESMWKKCTMQYIEKIDSQVDGFISNTDKIPMQVNSLINKNFIKTIMNQVYKNSKQYKYSKKNYRSFEIIIKEMIGSIYYNTKNNRQVKKNHTIQHLVGAQYSVRYCEALKEHYNELKNTDVWEIVNCILLSSNYFKQYFINSRGWRYNPTHRENNYCRQFDIFSNSRHLILNDTTRISFLIINSIKEYINLYNLISKSYNNIINIITYYSRTLYEVVQDFNNIFTQEQLVYDS
jgi:hypothetical protein